MQFSGSLLSLCHPAAAPREVTREASSVLVLWMLGLVLSRVAASAAGSCTLDSTCLVGVASTIGCERHDPHTAARPQTTPPTLPQLTAAPGRQISRPTRTACASA